MTCWRSTYSLPAHLKERTGRLIGILILMLAMTGLSLPAHAQFTLQSGVNSLVNGQAVSEGDGAFGDLNNDGLLDLIVTGRRQGGTSSTRIYVNNGTSLAFALGGIQNLQFSRLDLADFDNDGTIDVAICGEDAGVGYTKIYANSGLPSFTEDLAATANLPQVTQGDVAWGDYDNDGDLDLIVSGIENLSSNPSVKILNHDLANGTFTVDPIASINLIGLKSPSIEWVDFDIDGKLDLVMNGLNGNDDPRTYLYKNLGNAQFVLVPTASFLEVAKGTVTSGDIDNDGLPDILVCGEDDFGGLHTRVYRNQSDSNPGAPFVLSQALTGMVNAKAAFADFNNDGWVDILAAGNDGLGTNDRATIYYLNDGTGQFTASTTSLADAGSNPILAIGDYSSPADGKLDVFLSGVTLAPVTTNFFLYENTDPAANTVPNAPSGLTASVIGNTVEFSWVPPSNFLSGANLSLKDGLSYELSIGTLPDDDDQDPAHAAVPGGKRNIQVFGKIKDTTWTINNLPSNPNYFVRVQAIDAGLEGSAFSSAVNFSVSGIVPVASVYDDSTAFATGLPLPPGADDGFVSWCDCDADGDLDFMYGGNQSVFPTLDNFSRIYTNNGDGTFQYQPAASSLVPQIYQGDVAWGDVNNDGRPDLAVSGIEDSGPFGTPILEVLVSSGNCIMGTSISLTGVSNSSVDWGDVDADGDMDLLVTGKASSGPSLRVYLNSFAQTGIVSFTNSSNAFTGAGVENGEARFGDFDGDGDLDFAVSGLAVSGNLTRVFSNDGTGIFTEINQGILSGVKQSSVLWADLENDGTLELLIFGNQATSGLTTSFRVYKYFPLFSAFLSLTVSGLTDNTLQIADGSLDAGDYDNDGLIDILVTGRSGNTLSSSPLTAIYKNFGNLNFQQDALASLVLENVADGSEARFGDYNDDHKLDILLVGTGSTNNKVIKLYRNKDLNANTTPNSPQNLSDTLINFEVFLSWDAPTAPASNPGRINGYSYELYIDGPGAGPQDVVTAMSNLNNGYRRIVKLGNSMQNLEYVVTDLSPGTYTWGVQAIDQDWEGSGFATGGTFVYEDPTFVNVNSTIFPNGDNEGLGMSAVAWGDYHGDGHLDLVASGRNSLGVVSSKLYQYDPLNNFFLEDPLYSNVIEDVENGSFDWGDFDNDGDLDLLMTGKASTGPISRVYINIAGGFTPLDTLELFGLQGGDGKWGDINNDGFADIILCGYEDNGTAHTLVYVNSGTGTFSQVSDNLINCGAGDLALADFNQDGWLDVILSGSLNSSSGSGISQLYLNDGALGWTTAAVSGILPLKNSTISVGDVDANGFPDLILSGENNSNAKRSRFLRNLDGNTWTNAQNFTNPGIDASALGDYNDDGFLDLILLGDNPGAGGNTGLVYTFNSGTNQFDQATVPSSNVPDLGAGASAGFGDFDQDGKLDLVTIGPGATEEFSLLQNLDAAANFVPGKPRNPSVQIVGDEVIFSWQEPANVATLSYKQGISYQIVVGTTSGGTEQLSPLSDLTTGFRRVVAYARVYDTTSFRLKAIPAGSYFWSVQAIDTDYEGSLFETGPGFDFELPTFTDATTNTFPVAPVAVNSGDLAFADYDLDGDLDLMVAGSSSTGNVSTLYQNNGGKYTATPLSFTGVSDATTSWADVNGDNRPDLFLSGAVNPTTSFTGMYIGTGSNTFVNSGTGLPAVSESSVAWSDLDRDGDIDLLLTGTTSAGPVTEVFYNDGQGNFTAAQAGLTAVTGGSAAAMDLTSDGIPDLFYTGKINTGTWVTRLYEGIGNGSFVEITSGIPAVDNVRASFMDVDGDTDFDAVVTGGNTSASGRIYTNDGNGFFSLGQSTDGILSGSLLWGDLDENGRPDLLVIGDAGPSNIASYYRGTASGLEKSNIATIPITLTTNTTAALGDFSGDGKLDLAVIGTTSGLPSARSFKVYENIDPSTNKQPAAPSNLVATSLGDTILFTWSAPAGTANIVDGYSYQLVVGTTNQASDVLSPLSQAVNGERYIVRNGGQNQSLEAKVIGLPNDTYHWGVQAIDQDFEGSVFTYGTSINHVQPAFTDVNDEFWGTAPSTGLSKAAMAWADFDGDGKLDLAAAGEGENGFPVLEIYSQKFGGLALDATASQNLVGLEHAALAWGDIDLDGDPDLLVAGQAGTSGTQRQTRLYRNNNGVFVNVSAISDSLPQMRFASLDFGDVDGDGDVDLALIGETASGPVGAIYLNDNGLFREDRRRTIAALSEGDLEFGDFDRDGDLDLAVSGANGLVFEGLIYRNTGRRGDFELLSAAQANLIKTKESALAWVDYNNDGYLDLSISGETSTTLVQPLTRLYEYDEVNDEFDVVNSVTLPGFRNGDIEWGDFNDDGISDVLLSGKFGPLSSDRRTALYMTNGSGVLVLNAATTTYLKGADAGSDIATGDFDNDGKLDFALSGQVADAAPRRTITLYKNIDPAANTTLPAPGTPASVVEGDSVILTWQIPSGIPAAIADGVSYNITLSEVGGQQVVTPLSILPNGDRRIVAIGNVGNRNQHTIRALTSGEYVWRVQAIDQDFEGSAFSVEDTFDYVEPSFVDVTEALIAGGLPSVTEGDADWGDYDGDGDMDLILTGRLQTSNFFTELYSNTDGHTLQALGAAGLGIPELRESAVAWQDIDGDGDLDLAITGLGPGGRMTEILQNDGASFTSIASPMGVSNGDVAWIDAGQDGDPDLVLAGFTPGGRILEIYENAEGVFSPFATTSFTGLDQAKIAVMDVNADGRRDIVAAGFDGSNSRILLLLATITGGFTEIDLPGGTGISEPNIVFMDVDRNGTPDLLISGTDQGGNPVSQLLTNDGTGQFSASTPTQELHQGGLVVGDLDEDRDADLIIIGEDQSGSLAANVYDNLGDGTFQQLPALASDFTPVSGDVVMEQADVTGDGLLDLLVIGNDGSNSRAIIYENRLPVTNDRPAAPENLDKRIVGSKVVLSWDPPSGLTPEEEASLTYQVSLSSVTDGLEVVPGMFTDTGIRKVVSHGTSGYTTEISIENLQEGAIYSWTVQSIDQDYEGSPLPPDDSFSFDPPAFDDRTSVVFSGDPPVPVAEARIALGDYDADGDLDLLAVGETEAGNPSVAVFRNETTQSNGGRFVLDTALTQSLVPVASPALAWQDVNGDGFLDLLLSGKQADATARTTLYLYENGLYVEDMNASIVMPDVSSAMADIADYDRDGDVDIALGGLTDNGDRTLELYRQQSDGTWARDTAAFESVDNHDVAEGDLAFGDYDNDGDIDLAVSGISDIGQVTRIMKNDGAGVFAIGLYSKIVPVKNSRLAWGDFDNDGDLDLIVTGDNSTQSDFTPITALYEYFSENDEFEEFTNQDFEDLTQGSVSWGDFNNDGWIDILLSGKFGDADSARSTRLYRNQNGNEFLQDLNTSGDLVNVDLGAAAWGDYNGDQKLDVFLTGRTATTPSTYTFVVFENIDTLANQTPVQPLDPSTFVLGRDVTLSWDAPNYLPANQRDGLSFNIELYRKGAGESLTPANADTSSGYRRIVRQGNVWHNLSWTLTDLEDGEYVWKVQTVDQDFEGSAFTDEQEFSFTNPIPKIVSQDFDQLYENGGSEVRASIVINDADIVDQVAVFYKGIASGDWLQATAEGSGVNYSFTINGDVVDEMGVEYVFQVIGTYGYDAFSDTGYTYMRYPEGFEVTGLRSGKKFDDYDIIAIPLSLDNNSVSSVIEEYGQYNNRQWRLWNYSSGTLNEFTESSFNTFEPGKGYWLISKDPRSFNTGAGTVVEANDANPYEITLSQGYNQVGSPFPYALSWADILAANPQAVQTELEDFLAYEEAYVASDRIKRLRGGFIFAHTPVTLRIPVRKNDNVQRNDLRIPAHFEQMTDGEWFLPIDASLGGRTYRLAGFGMAVGADTSRDPLDRMIPPGFGDYLDIRVKHDEYFFENFTRDIVPLAKEYVWEFTVETNLEDPLLELTWDLSYLPPNGQKWMLFDVDNQKLIDLQDQLSYRSVGERTRRFRLYQGGSDFVTRMAVPDRIHLGDAYPNPFSSEVSIPFTLPPTQKNYDVRLIVRNQLGQHIATVYQGNLPSGFHEISWDGADQSGNRLSSGIYFYQLEVSDVQQNILSGKVRVE